MTLHYQHRQPATTMLVILTIVLLLDAVISTCILFGVGGSGPALLMGPLLVGALLVVLGVLFASLTVTIDEQFLTLRFGPGLIRKRVPLGDIATCRVTTTHWYDGWGIHFTTQGTLYNVSGFSAVALVLVNGKRICIGTDEPEALAEAIRRAARLTTRQTAG